MARQRNKPDLDTALGVLGLSGAELVVAETRATDTQVWGVDYNERPMAIRVHREDQQRVPDVEVAAMQLARAHQIPVPGVVARGMIDNRFPVMAIDWLSGELVGESLFRHPWLARRLGKAAGELLARMHAIPIPDSADVSPLHWDWASQGGSEDPEIRARLDEIADERQALLHLDYHPFNILAIGGRISGVLDWTNAAIGDLRADIARTVSIMQVVAPTMTASRGAHRMAMGVFTRAFLRAYCSARGELVDMAPFYTWAGLMLRVDLVPKVHALPVTDPDALVRRMDQWITHWRQQALSR